LLSEKQLDEVSIFILILVESDPSAKEVERD